MRILNQRKGLQLLIPEADTESYFNKDNANSTIQ